MPKVLRQNYHRCAFGVRRDSRVRGHLVASLSGQGAQGLGIAPMAHCMRLEHTAVTVCVNHSLPPSRDSQETPFQFGTEEGSSAAAAAL